jgi:uncharacterized membrane protein YfcA
MSDQLLYILCGLCAGLYGGYLGLGGGPVIVPFLTVLAGVDIKLAVPVSLTAIVVNSFTTSNEYLRKGMVDLELVIVLSVFMVLGNIAGSLLSAVVPGDYTRIILTVVLIYTAFSLLKGRKSTDRLVFSDNRGKYLVLCTLVAFATGTLSALVGIGGGIILVPVLYLVIRIPLATARGTVSLLIGFSAAAAATVYLLNGQIDATVLPGVVLGVIIGGKLGAHLGTTAKPLAVKIVLFVVMLYLAFRLSSEPIKEFLR